MHIKCVTSPDDGKTWRNRGLVYHAPRGVAAAPQIANCGGVLIVTFQSDEDGSETCMKAVSGRPGEWGNKMTIGPVGGNSTWGAIMTIGNESALAMFDNGGCKTRKISVRQ